MKWYDLLITDEFIDYFSNDNSIYYTDFKNRVEYTPQPIFKKFIDTVIGITYVSAKFDDDFMQHSSVKQAEPDIYSAYTLCKQSVSHDFNLSDIWQSMKLEETIFSPYEIEIETLNAEQLAHLIIYPFWNRTGGSWEIEFLESGRLKKYLLELKKKAHR